MNNKNTLLQIKKKLPKLSDMKISWHPPEALKPWEGNAREHSEKQITILAASIRKLGFRSPVVTDENNTILAGHGRVEAAKRIGLQSIPAVMAKGLSVAEKRAFVLADNKIAQMATWNQEGLRSEIEILLEEDFQIELTGFSTAEIDLMIDLPPAATDSEQIDPEEPSADDLAPSDLKVEPVVSRPGDLWILGNHRLYCGNALDEISYKRVMDGETAQMVITDPPYNVKIDGHVCGSGDIKHSEFAMASGEMTRAEFTDFLNSFFKLTASHSKDGAIVYSFMDWRHSLEIQNAAEPVFGPLRQLCVWAKDNGGMGTFYRSQHELVFIFKNGKASHINNFELGQNGRYRTNVWKYPGVNTFSGKGYELLKLHPTVKPVSLIADAIRDCSLINGLILDPFAGSGTILLAAERTKRHARAIELEPKFVDVGVRRWERITGEQAIHGETGVTFEETAIKRLEKEVSNEE